MMKMTKKNVSSSRGRSRTDTGAQTAAVWLITALSPNVYDDRWWMPRVARFGSGSGKAGSTIATRPLGSTFSIGQSQRSGER